MNWVGGSRNRLVMKNDGKRQREFFEKRKLQQRLSNLGMALPASPQGSTSGSMDLVTLFIVNQIAAKKESRADPPQVAVLGSSNRGSKLKRKGPLALPMSPCSPSQLCLVESQPQHSVQETRKRKFVIPQGFKYRQLSPVFESAFSDNSAPDYLPPINGPLSPFSSTSPATSNQGLFPLQLNLQQRSQTQPYPQCPPPPWDPGLEQTRFQPFSQRRGMTDSIPWSCGSNQTLHQLEIPTATGVLFGSPGPDDPVARDHASQEVTFSFNPPEDREHFLDFSLNPSETDHRVEEDVFRGFSAEECDREASYFGKGKLKIYLKDETPVKSSTPQTVPDLQCKGEEVGCKFSNCAAMNFSCVESDNGPMSCCDCSPNHSCSRGYLSSDSNDEEEGTPPNVQAACLYKACCVDVLSPNLGSQGNAKQRHTQPSLLTPPLKHEMKFRDEQKVMQDVVFPDKPIGGNSQKMRSHTAQSDSAEMQRAEPCNCQKTSGETHDAATQTADAIVAETRDASTQCSFVGNGGTGATGLSLFLPPTDVSVLHPATGRQTDAAAEPNVCAPSPEKASSRTRLLAWGQMTSRAGSVSGSSFINRFAANTDGKVTLQRPVNAPLDALTTTNTDGRGEKRGQRENGRVTNDASDEVREEVTPVTGISRLSAEAETVQEIADILLLLKQKK